MKIKSVNTILILALCSVIGMKSSRGDSYDNNAKLTTVNILLNDNSLAASDLVFDPSVIPESCQSVANGLSGVLSPETAFQLKNCGTDLSLLNPDPTQDVWSNVSSLVSEEQADAKIPVNQSDTLNVLAVVGASEGNFKLNVQTASGQTVTLLIARNAHPFLLRKELLRRLGYKVPAMKWVPFVNLKFTDAFSRDLILKSEIPNAVNASVSHWCSVSQSVYNTLQAGLTKDQIAPCAVDPNQTGTDPLTLNFNDVIITTPGPYDYPIEMDPPTQLNAAGTGVAPEGPRVLRDLSLVYALLNLNESVNQVDDYVASVQNGSITFTLPGQADYECTLDDALWILRKIAALTRNDFYQIVGSAYYPQAIAEVLVEKLIERRNSLITLFSQKTVGRDPKISAPLIEDNLQLNIPPYVTNGKVIQQYYPGWASRFADDAPPSPLQGLKWYLLSEVESNAMSALMTKANAEIPSLNQQDAEANNQQNLFNQAVKNYLTSGTLQAVSFGVWVAPIATGNVSISREVVLGDYLGTTTALGSAVPLVQLADNFSFGGNVGLVIGANGIPGFAQVQGEVLATASISLTHLKPLTTLKQGITEPIQNEFVPWLYEHAGSLIKAAANSPQATASSTPTEITADSTELTAELEKFKKFLGVGESLIITESLNGAESLSGGLQASVPLSPSITAQFAANQLVISRLHIYRSSENNIEIFKDKGDLFSLGLSLNVGIGTAAAQFPVLTLSLSADKGKASLKLYNVNINPDTKADPTVYASSKALAQTLRTGSLEVLESLIKPTVVTENFTDKTSTFNFFHYVHRSVSGNATMTVALPDGTTDQYLNLNTGTQSGKNYQSLATDAATFLVQVLTKNAAYSISTQASSNPGQSFLGSSQTRELNFQGQLVGSGLTQPYVSIQYRWEGWQDSVAQMQAVIDAESSKFGFQLYPSNVLADAKDIKLYDLSLNISIYQNGLNKLTSISKQDLKTLTDNYSALHNCADYPDDLQDMAGGDETICAKMDDFEGDLGDYSRAKGNSTKQAKALFAMVNDLEQFVTFTDLVNLVGGSQNLFVQSQITGFREGSETLSNAINSNTFGTPDPYNPSGIINTVQQILNIDSGEFNMEWLRSFL
jgi:hypothetical protein